MSIPPGIALSLLCLPLLAACSHTPQDDRDAATVKVYQTLFNHKVSLRAVDGNVVDSPVAIRVSPGGHQLSVLLEKHSASSKTCDQVLSFPGFESDQIYGVFEGDWNGTPTLFLKGARGEILDSRDVTDCLG